MYARRRRDRSGACRERARAIRIRCFASSWRRASARPSRATRCAREVIPVYMGLIKQIDDQMGRAVPVPGATRTVRQHDDRVHLRSRRLSRRPLARRKGVLPRAVGEDPADHLRSRPRDATRGSVCDELVEAIDLAPTFLDALGADPEQQSHRLEGRSLHAVAARPIRRRAGGTIRSANTTIRSSRSPKRWALRRVTRACS